MASKASKGAAKAGAKVASKIVKEGGNENKTLHPKEKSIFQLVNGLRYFGLGSKVTRYIINISLIFHYSSYSFRTIYKFPDTYWILTKVVLSKDQMHGSIWGRMVWKGRSKPGNERIGRALKPDWKLIGLPNYKHFKGSPTEIEEIIKTSAEPYIDEEEFKKIINNEINNNLQYKETQ